MASMNQGRVSSTHSSLRSDHLMGGANFGNGKASFLEKDREEKPEINLNRITVDTTLRQSQQNQLSVVDNQKKNGKQHDSRDQNQKPFPVFKGKTFHFSDSFPEDRVSASN